LPMGRYGEIWGDAGRELVSFCLPPWLRAGTCVVRLGEAPSLSTHPYLLLASLTLQADRLVARLVEQLARRGDREGVVDRDDVRARGRELGDERPLLISGNLG